MCGDVERDDGAITPESLEAVEHALFLVEDVCDDVSEVQQDPSAKVPTLAAQGFAAGLDCLVFDFVCDCLDVSFVATSDQDEDVDDREGLGNVESDDVLTLFGVSRSGDDLGEVDGFLLCSHGVK